MTNAFIRIINFLLIFLPALLLARQLTCLLKSDKKRLNEIYVISIFMYSLLVLWNVTFSLSSWLESNIDNFKLAGKYIGSLIQSGYFIILQFMFYKISINQKMNFKGSMFLISLQKNNNDKLMKYIYVFLVIEVFLQSTLVGLVPFFQTDDDIYVDIITCLIILIAILHFILNLRIIRSYNKQSFYLKTMTVFTTVSFFKSLSNGVLERFPGFLNVPGDTKTTIIYLLFYNMNIVMTFIQIICYVSDIFNIKSKETFYD